MFYYSNPQIIKPYPLSTVNQIGYFFHYLFFSSILFVLRSWSSFQNDSLHSASQTARICGRRRAPPIRKAVKDKDFTSQLTGRTNHSLPLRKHTLKPADACTSNSKAKTQEEACSKGALPNDLSGIRCAYLTNACPGIHLSTKQLRNNLFIFPVKLQSELWDFGELYYLYYKSLAAMLGSCTVGTKANGAGG